MEENKQSLELTNELAHAIEALRAAIAQLSDPEQVRLDRRFETSRQEQLKLLEEVEKRLKAEIVSHTIGLPTHSAIGTLVETDIKVRGIEPMPKILDRVDEIISATKKEILAESLTTKKFWNSMSWVIGVFGVSLVGALGSAGTFTYSAQKVIDEMPKVVARIDKLEDSGITNTAFNATLDQIERLKANLRKIESDIMVLDPEGIKSNAKVHDEKLSQLDKRVSAIASSLSSIRQGPRN